MATAARVAPVPDEPRGRPATALGRVALFLTLALPGWLAAVACPSGTVPIGDQYCIDRYEATLDQDSRAVSTPGALPAVNVSGVQAAAACAAAAKRLCTNEEWVRACKGPDSFTYPYGNTLVPGVCNDQGALAVTGAYPGCVSGEGAYDMVGNVGEWTADPGGTFRGGYFADISINGAGCNYATTAHDASFADGKTGFRCCSDDLAIYPPSLTGAVARKVHGAAGAFNLPLAAAASPTTEPRTGGAAGEHTIVFTFDKPVTDGVAAVTAGVATAGLPAFRDNEMAVPLTAVANAQYVTLAVSDVASADGGTGGAGSVRIGFLTGDVNGQDDCRSTGHAA